MFAKTKAKKRQRAAGTILAACVALLLSLWALPGSLWADPDDPAAETSEVSDVSADQADVTASLAGGGSENPASEDLDQNGADQVNSDTVLDDTETSPSAILTTAEDGDDEAAVEEDDGIPAVARVVVDAEDSYNMPVITNCPICGENHCYATSGVADYRARYSFDVSFYDASDNEIDLCNYSLESWLQVSDPSVVSVDWNPYVGDPSFWITNQGATKVGSATVTIKNPSTGEVVKTIQVTTREAETPTFVPNDEYAFDAGLVGTDDNYGVSPKYICGSYTYGEYVEILGGV